MAQAAIQQPRNFQAWSNISATPGSFNLDAGAFGLSLAATWGGGSAALQKLMPDGTTWVTVTSVTANGYAEVHVPAGIFQLLVTTATALTGEIAKIAAGSG